MIITIVNIIYRVQHAHTMPMHQARAPSPRHGRQDQPTLKRQKLRLGERKSSAEVMRPRNVCCQDIVLPREGVADCAVSPDGRLQASTIRPRPESAFQRCGKTQALLQTHSRLDWASVGHPNACWNLGVRRASRNLCTWSGSPWSRQEQGDAASRPRMVSRTP